MPWDHPRIRGEHISISVFEITSPGSSPHTRGAHRGSNRPPRDRRIIPAYAGSTPTTGTARSNPWDHPRIRGEHLRMHLVRDGDDGSSPHTRGAPASPVVRVAEGGIIPAYAGSTWRRLVALRPSRDHPRIRGEHHLHTVVPAVDRGSSPHTRGALHRRPHLRRRRRIIPAYAGSTSATGYAPCSRWDHPRIRGEHVDYEYLTTYYDGSSPHTRGAPHERRCEEF